MVNTTNHSCSAAINHGGVQQPQAAVHLLKKIKHIELYIYIYISI